MKKFGKFLFGTISIATVAAGAYYLYKNYFKNDASGDFDEFDDDYEDSDAEDESDKESREYVPINIAPNEKSENEQPPEASDAGE